MNTIDGYILSIEDLPEFIESKYLEYFNRNSKGEVKKIIQNLVNNLSDIKYVYFEYPYVEKIYRDTYYNFFSTKHKEYHKNCMRIALFSMPIENEDFRSREKKAKLVDSFHGVFTIRPTYPYILGWNLISPKNIVGTSELTFCSKKYKFLINGV
ncbi:MAG: hypothetical protein H7X99_05310, partial [Saprospiraceae bacterium]|nr:hypothetical protein [Saprospiraceae bacterium]